MPSLPLAAHAPFSVFQSAIDDSLAVVVANYSAEERTVDVLVAARPAESYRLVDGNGWLDAVAALKTAKDYSDFVEERLARWNESKPH